MKTGLTYVTKPGLFVLALLALSGCDPASLERPISSPKPVYRDEDMLRPRSTESRALKQYYAKVQAGLLAQGLLRRDGGGPDVPFSKRNLVDNFIRIAMFDEYTSIGGRIIAGQTASQLRKWINPIQMDIEFGPSIPLAQRSQDRASIQSYAARLSRISNLPIRQSRQNSNFHVFVVNEDERRTLAPRLRQILPGIDEAALKTVIDLPRSTFCLVFALDPGDRGLYSQAVAIIRGEHPDLLRLSCIHEELAQGLGLANDSPRARPSVFNDDEEFGLLTNQDELLLQMLYDPRMKPGMDEKAAREMAEIIADELMAADPQS